jgi:transaldolase
MSTILDSLKQHSTIVADTGDFESSQKYQPQDATTNPSLLFKAAPMPEYAELVDKAVADAKSEAGSSDALGIAMPSPRCLATSPLRPVVDLHGHAQSSQRLSVPIEGGDSGLKNAGTSSPLHTDDVC